MSIRKRSLPAGWYPEDAAGIDSWIDEWTRKNSGLDSTSGRATAGIVPHAGWYFSGEPAFLVLRAVDPSVETVVVVGGHLPPNGPVLAAVEEAYETPAGTIQADRELLRAITARLSWSADREADNTVEVQLPLVHRLLPGARAISFRAPPGDSALALGEAIAECARLLGRRVAVVGSTDLTHYGPQYRFTPAGMGEPALRWVKEENDAGMIRCLLEMDGESTIRYAVEHRAACSPGGAAAAIAFARAVHADEAKLLSYCTSRDRGPSSSFVGYAAITYSRHRDNA